MDHMVAGEDFYPFPNSGFALLYLLLHSPRPVVSYTEIILSLFCSTLNFIIMKGEGNMKFVCQMLQKKDPYSPSLSQLRRFTLPDFKHPTKVYQTSGIISGGAFTSYLLWD